MGGASTLRDTVEAAGSRLDLSVRELRDSFGIVSLTTVGRERIARELGAVGLRLEPSLGRLGLDERITIVGRRPRLRLVPAPPSPSPSRRRSPPPVAVGADRRRSFWSNRRRAVMAGVGVGLLVILVAAVFGWNVGKDEPQAGSIPAPAAAASPPATVSPPAAAGAKGHPKVVASLQKVDDALAQDDPASARRIMNRLDPAVLERRRRSHPPGPHPAQPDPPHRELPGGDRPGRGRTLRRGPREDARARPVPRRRGQGAPLRGGDREGPRHPGAHGGRRSAPTTRSRCWTRPRRSRPPFRRSPRSGPRRPAGSDGRVRWRANRPGGGAR